MTPCPEIVLSTFVKTELVTLLAPVMKLQNSFDS
jgi:hypothetical protein